MEINFITFLSYLHDKRLRIGNTVEKLKMSRLKDVARPWRRRKITERKFACDSSPCRFAVSLKIIASTLRMYHVCAVKISQIKVNSFHSRRYRAEAFLWSGKFETFFFFFDSHKRRFLLYIRTGRHLNLTVSGSRHRQLDFRDRMRRSKEILSVPRKFCWGQDTRWSTLKVDERYHGVNGVPRN